MALDSAGNKTGCNKEDIYLVAYLPIINRETNTPKHSPVTSHVENTLPRSPLLEAFPAVLMIRDKTVRILFTYRS